MESLQHCVECFLVPEFGWHVSNGEATRSRFCLLRAATSFSHDADKHIDVVKEDVSKRFLVDAHLEASRDCPHCPQTCLDVRCLGIDRLRQGPVFRTRTTGTKAPKACHMGATMAFKGHMYFAAHWQVCPQSSTDLRKRGSMCHARHSGHPTVLTSPSCRLVSGSLAS